jgi:hypothetical protein
VLCVSAPYRPGQYQAQDQTTRIPPVRSRPGPPRAPQPGKPGNSKTREYVLKGLGLVLVAVVSGMLWWLIQQGNRPEGSETTGTSATQEPATKFQFTKHEQVQSLVVDSNCEEHSYQKVKQFFASTPCERLTRLLYTADVNGRKAYSSVSLVKMKNQADADALLKLAEGNNTGNVSDLVREGRVKVNGLRSLSKGFAGEAKGAEVVIVETDFEGGSKSADEKILDEISTDALRLAGDLRK